MKFYAEMGFTLHGDPSLLERRLCALMDQLLAIEESDAAVQDPDVTATLSTGATLVNMYLDAADLPEAGHKLVATVRHALHAIGDGTPGWEQIAEQVQAQCMAVRPADARALVA